MEASPLKGSKTALIGLAKTGKTVATQTLAQIEGLKVNFLFTENSADRIAHLHDRHPNWHWASVQPVVASLDEIWDAGNDLNTKTFKELSSGDGIHRERYRQFLDVVVVANNFICAQCGKALGSADAWGPDTVFVVDGLSNLSYMALRLVVGSKPQIHESQWGMAMGHLEAWLMWLTNGLMCHLILIAHIEPELNPATNLYQNMMSTLGKKLAPKLPKLFSDVILARRSGADFDWTNIEDDTSVGPGLLPPTASMPPTFVPLFAAWQAKGGLFSPTYKENLTLKAPANSGPQPEAKPQT